MSQQDDKLKSAIHGRVGLPLELEDGAPPALYSRLLLVLTLATVGLLVWASFGKIKEVAQTVGEIAPAGSIQAIEHLEGGIVADVLVEEGDLVKAGAPLVRLAKTDTTTELGRITGRLAYLEREERRLVAQENGNRPADLRLTTTLDGLTNQQMEALNANIRAQKEEEEALAARVAQKAAEVRSLEAQLELQISQVELEKEKYDIQAGLLKQGYTSKRRYLESKSEYQRSQVAKEQLAGNLAQAREMHVEALASLSQAGAEVSRDLADERSRIAQERAELSKEIEKLRDREARLFVRAPVDGFVKSIAQTGSGSVVNPGDLIAEIVPVDEELIAEVRVKPKDIGHVDIGDTADIAITSYDPNIQGTISGIVRTISASSFQDENGQYYFKAVLGFPGRTIGAGENERPVRPGMQVNAKIVTGSKSIMTYLLKPITRAMDTIFSER